MLNLKEILYHPPASAEPILKSITLELGFQQLGVIVGPSGSGKTTLLEILAGLAEQTQGKISWSGQEITSSELQQISGLVFQFPERHFCGSNILEELRLGHLEITREEVEIALEEVGLQNIVLSTSPHNISGGQQRRLALAVQLIRQPNLLLLDEPTAGLDWSMHKQLINLVFKLKRHWTLIIVSHDPSELLTVADKCWKIDGGQLEQVDIEFKKSKYLKNYS